VKAEHRPQFPGIVHDSSASGATVFIEPASVVDMGNDLKELAFKEQQEIDRILKHLSGMIRAAAREMRVTTDALGRIDFASAKGRLSCDMDAVEPDLNRDGRIDMIKARHPLLKGTVVPIDIQLGGAFKALLITGPNTGGKTVTLKTTGLLTIMAQSGLHVPADPGSRMAVFDQVFADIGDEQSIQQSLSTFSAHLLNIVHITRNIGSNTLVLLDEIGAGTDPDEGAALAKAILDYLVAHNARTIATTHYGELKEFAFVREEICNASVEFDIQTLQPTYRLMIGVPGSSNAFAIASRLGLSSEIVDAATELVSGGEASDEILRKIEETHRSATEREQIAQRASKDIEILKSRYEQRVDEVDALRREMRQQLASELDRRVREKVAELDSIVEDVKKHRSEPRIYHENRQRFRRRVAEIRQEIDEIVPAAPVESEPDAPAVLKIGDTVTLTTYGMDGVLLNNPGDHEALVMVGSMKVNVPFSTLRRARAQKQKPESNVRVAEIPSMKAQNVSAELKLIAQRVEQALINLDKYLDDAYLGGLPAVRIIHGKGTGALRKAVWEFLKTHHAVESYRLADLKDGGEGATIVKFKDR
jgi:DNA mismatch repair protein MutS2